MTLSVQMATEENRRSIRVASAGSSQQHAYASGHRYNLATLGLFVHQIIYFRRPPNRRKTLELGVRRCNVFISYLFLLQSNKAASEQHTDITVLIYVNREFNTTRDKRIFALFSIRANVHQTMLRSSGEINGKLKDSK